MKLNNPAIKDLRRPFCFYSLLNVITGPSSRCWWSKLYYPFSWGPSLPQLSFWAITIVFAYIFTLSTYQLRIKQVAVKLEPLLSFLKALPFLLRLFLVSSSFSFSLPLRSLVLLRQVLSKQLIALIFLFLIALSSLIS